jgi:hypothetical protein
MKKTDFASNQYYINGSIQDNIGSYWRKPQTILLTTNNFESKLIDGVLQRKIDRQGRPATQWAIPPQFHPKISTLDSLHLSAMADKHRH